MVELLDKLKEGKIMAAIVGRDGKAIASNFTLHEGIEGYVASSFNVGDSFLREVGEEASELVISTDKGNIVIRNVGNNRVLIAQILTKEQYALYKELIAGAAAAPKKKAAASKAAVPKKAAAKEEADVAEPEEAQEAPKEEAKPAKGEAAREKPEKGEAIPKKEEAPAEEGSEGKEEEKKAEE
ncbi:roadblock/LC7 domain-containing protein [Candidatus Micrarchaeota archaeon]|nr:roadblock/LC7 domain-containing protein [Candidatus Micrarchaeota archaeon]